MGGQFSAEEFHQRRVHETVVVGNPQRDHLLAGDFLRKILAQPVGMLALHAEDLVGPAEETGGDLDAGTVPGAGAAGLVAGMVLEEGLGGG